MSQLTDRELLERITEPPYVDRIGQKARKAFTEWLDGRLLTPAMKRWLRGEAERLGIQTAPSENLFSQLSPERQAEQRERAAKYAPLLPWEKK